MSQKARVAVLPGPFTSSLLLAKFFMFSVPQFPHLYNRDNSSNYFRGCCEDEMRNCRESIRTAPSTQEALSRC